MLKRISQFCYSTLIKRNPKGVNRYQYMDTYIASHNHPHIKTYLDYENNYIIPVSYFNKISHKNQAMYTLTTIRKSDSRFGVLYDYIILPRQSDDNQLIKDISNLTLKQFIIDCFLRREIQHHLPITIMITVVFVIIWGLVIYYIPPNKKNQVKLLNPQVQFEYQFQALKINLQNLRKQEQLSLKQYQQALVNIKKI